MYLKLLPLKIAMVLLVAAGDPAAAGDAREAAAGNAQESTGAVAPLLAAKCVSCHGPDKQEGGLRLDSLAAAVQGGDTGPAIVPGDPAKSLLVKAIRFDDPDLQMPPKDRLSDEQIELLVRWVKAGAAWPRPVLVLFDDEEPFLATLDKGQAQARFERRDVHRGKLAVAVTPREKYAEQIADWRFSVREKPARGEYRFLRFAWKKIGGGGAMLEVAREGKWPPAKASPPPGGRYVAGPNQTGMDAIAVGDTAPTDWTEVTIDLWKDLGDCQVTGLSLMASGTGETLFDTFLLAASREDLDAWSPGLGNLAFAPPPRQETFGAALVDPRNPIRQLFGGERLDLWSLQTPAHPDGIGQPDPTLAERSATIDTLVLNRLTAAGLKPSSEADRRTLICRLTLDLTGLPPTPDEVAEFVNDSSPQAYEQLVTRLLASPHYGQRQARLWLDVVRYADTHGYERDEFRPLIWQYRDYVIRAFNEDKRFDRFIREQLAGDELVNGPPRNPAEVDALIATGYLRLGQWDSTASIFQEEDRLRAEMMADVTNTTASAFLGLTISCCQCHDHKFDPFSQADHYRLQAFFAGMKPRDDLVVELPDTLAEINAHNAALDREIEPLKAAQATLNKDEESGKSRHAELGKQIAALAEQKRQPRVAMGAADAGPAAPATHVLYQGDFHAPRDEVSPGFVSALDPGPAVVEAPRGDTTGRRLALANWIASPDNPWTARVIVNRIWQQHFGRGLVATPNDLGYSGARPTHPELLDTLALDFVNDGWSIKRLHQAIVMSATYRQASRRGRQGDTESGRQGADGASLAVAPAGIDPDNNLLWRQNVWRLDAETLRDRLLAVAGLLKPYPGGKPLWPEVPVELLEAQPAILEALEGKDGGRMQGWYADPVEQTDVRSVFLIRKRCLPIPFLQVFDLPDTTVSCARRDSTVVAPQALMLLNSPAAVRLAEAFANRTAKPIGKLDFDDPDCLLRVVDTVFQSALVRAPDAEERSLASDLLRRHARQHRTAGAEEDAQRLALVDLCRAVLNLNEFVYVD